MGDAIIEKNKLGVMGSGANDGSMVVEEKMGVEAPILPTEDPLLKFKRLTREDKVDTKGKRFIS